MSLLCYDCVIVELAESWLVLRKSVLIKSKSETNQSKNASETEIEPRSLKVVFVSRAISSARIANTSLQSQTDQTAANIVVTTLQYTSKSHHKQKSQIIPGGHKSMPVTWRQASPPKLHNGGGGQWRPWKNSECLVARGGGSRDDGLEEVEGWQTWPAKSERPECFFGFTIHTFNCWLTERLGSAQSAAASLSRLSTAALSD